MISHQIPRLFNAMAKVQSCSSFRFLNTTSNKFQRILTTEQLHVTPKAANRVKEIADDGERLRVEVDGGGCSGFEYKIRMDKDLNDDDLLWKSDNGAEIVVDEISLGYMKGATVDFVEDLMKSSFRIVNNPVADKGCSCGTSFALKMD